MSDTIHTLVPAESTAAVAAVDRRDVQIISIYTLTIFLVALIIAAVLGWYTKEYTLLVSMCSIIAAKFGDVVGFFVGSSRSSDKKTDLLAQAPPVGTKP